MKAHRLVCVLSFVALTLLLALSVSRLGYKEDIADFLPVDSKHHNAMKVYQNISGANKIFAVFQYRDTAKADPDVMVECVDRFVDEVQNADTAHVLQGIMSQVDLEKMTEITDFVYANIPYFLTDADYAHIDSVLALPGYVAAQLGQDKQMLMFPSGGLLSGNIRRDPLNLFTPVVQKLQRADTGIDYEMYDGHIFSPDMQRAMVMMESPYGASETEQNSKLVKMFDDCARRTVSGGSNVDIHIIGGPVIAVTNATQIKSDSILSVVISVTLILALLLFSFRNVRNLLLIAFSIAWGWLFAMGGLALFHDRVSVIVIGISSVILGIAVNYPLHFIAHLSHTPDRKKALREIVMPLLVGNVTTVGAFLALVPLQSVALRDLGLFSSLLLIGTIFFVLVYLPHLSRKTKEEKHTFLDRLSNVSLENKPVFVAVVAVLTVVFGYFSLQTRFDANMSHINYMTDEQKTDMEYFQRTMVRSGEQQSVYAISTDSTIDGALDKSMRLQPLLAKLKAADSISQYSGCSQFIVSKAEQKRRLERWRTFVERKGNAVEAALAAEMGKVGFAAGSFDEFRGLLAADYSPQPLSHFKPLTSALFSQNISCDSVAKQYSVIDVLKVGDADLKDVESALEAHDCYSFDVASMNSAIANHLSDDFNYIGFACGFIVFFFLWLSMGSIELAILSFVPMAVSWLWILGIMAILGMQFNIVNIILATFIFGQGDDYTIFMTEGASYEYAYRRKMLASYKHSIIISALIMFIGIGTLIVARHPALRSLAQVTIAGMFSVVLMAYIFPPLIFKFLVQTADGRYRKRPVSLVPLLARCVAATVLFAAKVVMFVSGVLLLKVLKSTPRRRAMFRVCMHHTALAAVRCLPTVKFSVKAERSTCIGKSAVVVCDCSSVLRLFALMAFSSRIVPLSACRADWGFMLNNVLRWACCRQAAADSAVDEDHIKKCVAAGLIPVLSPCRLATTAPLLSCVVPVVVHGADAVFTKGGMCLYAGQISVVVLPTVTVTGTAEGNGGAVEAERFAEYYETEKARVARRQENADSIAPLVLDRYRYKGAELFAAVKRSMRKHANYSAAADTPPQTGTVVVLNGSWGEFALLYALVHGEQKVLVAEPNVDRRAVLEYSAEGVAANLRVFASAADALTAADSGVLGVFALDADGFPVLQPASASVQNVQN